MALTSEQRAEIRAREQAEGLTGSPWLAFARTIAGPSDGCNCAAPFDGHQVHEPYCGMEPIADAGREADAEFIAHARQDVPTLLAEVDRLTAENELLRRPMAAYSKAGDLSDLEDWEPISAGRYAELEQAEADLAQARQRMWKAAGRIEALEDWKRPELVRIVDLLQPMTQRALTGQDGGGDD